MYKNKLIFTADIHLSEKKIKYVKKAIEFLKEYVKKEKPKFVVIAGDFFDERLPEGSEVYNYAIDTIVELSFNCKNLLVIKGTHSHDSNMLNILNVIKKTRLNIHYYDKFTPSVEIDNIKFTLIPEEYPENFNKYYKQLFTKEINTDIVVGHGNLYGAKFHSGIDNKRLKDIKFNHKDIEENTNCKLNLWGHIHLRQNLSDKTHYVGSLAKTSFADKEAKGFYDIDLKNYKINFIKTPNYNFITIDEDEIENIEDVIKIINDRNNIVKIIAYKDSEKYKKILEKIDKKIYFQNKLYKENSKGELVENKIIHRNIYHKTFEEQFKEIINYEIENKKLTKKQKKFLTNNSINEKIKELKKLAIQELNEIEG